MRKYYTRPCNFFYGNEAKKLIKKKIAFPLAGKSNIAFDQIEIIYRKQKRLSISEILPITEVKFLNKEKSISVQKDLKNITAKRKNIAGLNFDKPKIMGVLNMTPDSFSENGLFFDKTKSFDHTKFMINSGADIIDIGGESTRPGSNSVDEKVEWLRVKNNILNVKKEFPGIVVSLDTRKSYVMKKGIESKVNIINDVSGLSFDKNSLSTISSNKIPFILNHMKGKTETMQKNPKYDDVILDIYDFFENKINLCIKKKLNKNLIILDPGIGFGKNLKHNLRIISKISLFHSLGCPILIGTSRKRFIEHIVTKFDTPDRTGGTLASVLYGLSQGVQLFRVHNVKEINQGILVFNKILNTN